MSDNLSPSIEQAERATEEIALMGVAYFESLFKVGFTRDESFELTQDFLRLYWQMVMGGASNKLDS